MNLPKLVTMANQIASFFATDPDRAAGVASTANHIQKFWEPRMRKELLAGFDAGKCDGLHELVVAAVQQHRAQLEPIAVG